MNRLPTAWIALLAATVVMAQVSSGLPDPWRIGPPPGLALDLAGRISAGMDWLMQEARLGPVSFRELTRGFAWALEQPYALARAALVDGWTRGRGASEVAVLPPLAWSAVVLAVAAMGAYASGWRLALLAGGCFLYLAAFGQWASAMVTLASVVIAVPLGVAGGLGLGIAAYLWRGFERALTPVLDLMQTVPTFAYLVPILFMFGFGPVAALVATVVYAMPPMVRVTVLALRSVPEEIREFSVMVGCTASQRIWRVLVPTALPDLMVGVNQVIMLALNMVIIASMIGAGGLGYDVLAALRRLDIGAGVEAGLAIVALAIALDRLSQAFAIRAGRPGAGSGRWLALVLAAIVAAGLLGLAVPAIQRYPEAAVLSTGEFWDGLVRSINVGYFDQLEALKTAMLVNLLLPVKRFLLALPWPWVAFLVAFAGWRLDGPRLAALGLALTLFVVVNGLWEPAMTSLYLCGVAVAIATLIGLPLGILAALSPTAGRAIGAVIDTLQTLPSFVYLIPVVMLFRVGDFTAMIAIVLYALAPAVRYAAQGVRSAPPELIEAGLAMGCTPGQILRRIRLPLALPQIMLGLNQTIMLALSMLVITALVGTRDLGQEVYIALTRADTGQGLVAGVAVACIAIVADRLIAAGAARTRARLGLTEARA